MTLKSLKLTEEAIAAVNDFKAEFQLKNQSEVVVLGLGWARQFFSSNVEVKNELGTKVREHDILIGVLLKEVQHLKGIILPKNKQKER